MSHFQHSANITADGNETEIMKTGIKLNRLLLAMVMGVLLPMSFPCAQGKTNEASTTELSTDQILSQLERQFFEHTYKDESQDKRLSRLENFVYGSSQNGSTDSRLKNLLSAIPSRDLKNQSANTKSGNGSNDNTSPDQKTPSLATEKPTLSQPDQAPIGNAGQNSGAGPFDYNSYPRVNALEQELLGQTYLNDPLPQRLNRLEKKAFGKPSDSNDLAQRVDALEEYAERHDLYGEHMSHTTTGTIVPFTQMAQNNQYQQNSGQANQDAYYGQTPSGEQQTTSSTGQQYMSPVGSSQQLVSAMEKQIFHNTYPHKSLISRVSKLEKHVFKGQTNPHASLTARIDNLWYTLHPNNQVADNTQTMSDTYAASSSNQSLGAQNTNYSAKAKKHHGWLHKVAKVAGEVAGGVAKGVMYSSMYSGYGMGYGGYGMGYGGYGMGMGYPMMGGYGMGMGYPMMGGYGMGMGSPMMGGYW